MQNSSARRGLTPFQELLYGRMQQAAPWLGTINATAKNIREYLLPDKPGTREDSIETALTALERKGLVAVNRAAKTRHVAILGAQAAVVAEAPKIIESPRLEAAKPGIPKVTISPAEHPTRIFGAFRNVMLTEKQFNDLASRGKKRYVDLLSAYMVEKNREYANHYATILKWILQDENRYEIRGSKEETPKNGQSFNTDEFIQAVLNRKEF